MFTGLVEALGRLAAVVDEPPGKRLVIEAAEIAAEAALGESICTSGCCLSVVRIDGPRIEFQAGPETLSRTTLGGLEPGDPVNLERSLRLSDRLGGHLVTGHVDGLGRLAGSGPALAPGAASVAAATIVAIADRMYAALQNKKRNYIYDAYL